MTRALGFALSLSLALTACEEAAPEPPEGAGQRAADAPARGCGPQTFGVPAYDALLEVGVPGVPLLYAREVAGWIEHPQAEELARRLEAAARVDAGSLPDAARITLANDVWGLWARAGALTSSQPSATRIRAAAASLIARLAVTPTTPRAPPAFIARALPSADGWRELEPEMPVLSHERFFGLRRHFHVRARGQERALYSTLVAIDPRGRPRPTDVVGDLEMLRFDGDELLAARLFELDRRHLRCPEEGEPLTEVEVARQVPGLGADDVLAEFDPPAPLSELPCARCHDDAQAMSLPSETLTLGGRNPALLEQAVVP